jgi:hypothetical protein
MVSEIHTKQLIISQWRKLKKFLIEKHLVEVQITMVESSSLRTLEIMPRNLTVTVRSWIPPQGGGGCVPSPWIHTPPFPSPPLRALPITKRPHPSVTLHSSYPVDQVIGGKDQGGDSTDHSTPISSSQQPFLRSCWVVKKQKCCGCGTAISVKIMPMKCASVMS